MKTTTEIKWSTEQNLIFRFFERGAYGPQNLDGTGDAVIEARAGTGKTTTIKAAFEFAPEGKILYAVFNKKNQREAEEKIKDHRVDVKTLHSLGFGFIKRVWGGAKPDDTVEYDRADFAMREFKMADTSTRREVAGAVVKLVGFAKNTTINTTPDDLNRIAEDRDIYVDGVGTELLVMFAKEVLEASKVKRPDGKISFDDMVWLPVAMNWVRPWYDLVCVDEAQDMNLPQLAMAKAARKPGGRVIVVGDNRQAIYGFRGAANGGMAMMKATLRATELKLTTTYRCPKAVVQIAREIVPDYNAAPEAPEGKVSHISEGSAVNSVTPGDVILSRLNAPLMPLALSLIRKGTPARIEGRDIARQLITMVRTLKASSIEHFLEKLEEWVKKQCARLASAKNADKKIEQVEDIAATLRAVAEGLDTVPEIEKRLNEMFQDSVEPGKKTPCVILSSVHKAKGLEWDRVFLLSKTFAPRKNTKPSDAQELENIYYVAVTRAKRELFMVSEGGTPEPAKPAKPQAAKEPSQEAPKPAEAPKASEPALNPATRLQKGVATASGIVLQTPEEIYEAMSEPTLPGCIYREPGMVFSYSGREYVVATLSKSNARCVCLESGTRTIKFREKGTMDEKEKEIKESPGRLTVSTQMDRGDLIRRMTMKELEEFLNGTHRGRAGSNITTNGGETNNSMKKEAKAKTAVSTKDLGTLSGSAKFVRELHASGISKEEALTKAVKKFPILGVGEHFNVRWDTAVSLAAHKAKAVKASAAKPAVKSSAPAKPAAKKPTPKVPAKPAAKPAKVPPRPAAAKTSVPPRPVAPAPAPVEAPEAPEAN